MFFFAVQYYRFFAMNKLCKLRIKEISPILWICTALLIMNFILLAFIGQTKNLPGFFQMKPGSFFIYMFMVIPSAASAEPSMPDLSSARSR